MTARKLTEKDESQEIGSKRKRRHWYDHEKMSIIKAYDRGELQSAPGKANHIIDPKSGEILAVFQIESWKDIFRTMGLLKKAAPVAQGSRQVMATSTKFVPSQDSSVQNLLVSLAIENQKLKEALSRKSPSSESENEANV